MKKDCKIVDSTSPSINAWSTHSGYWGDWDSETDIRRGQGKGFNSMKKQTSASFTANGSAKESWLPRWWGYIQIYRGLLSLYQWWLRRRRPMSKCRGFNRKPMTTDDADHESSNVHAFTVYHGSEASSYREFKWTRYFYARTGVSIMTK